MNFGRPSERGEPRFRWRANDFFTSAVDTPLGSLFFVADTEEALHLAFWDEQHAEARRHWQRWYPQLPWPAQGHSSHIERCLQSYFHGDTGCLAALRTVLRGTEFQREVWSALAAIPAGSTVTYGTLGHWLHRPHAARAIGQAVGSNPVALIVPCHRVVAAGGALGGYAGGAHRKRWLIAHEARNPPHPRG